MSKKLPEEWSKIPVEDAIKRLVDEVSEYSDGYMVAEVRDAEGNDSDLRLLFIVGDKELIAAFEESNKE